MLALKMIMNNVDAIEDKINNIESRIDPYGVVSQARAKRTRMEVS